MRKLFYVGILLIGLSVCATAQVASAKKYKVAISVGGDVNLKSDVTSYVARELRSLGDVEVAEYGDFLMVVVVTKSNMTDGRDVGYSMSVSLIENVYCGDHIYQNFLTGFLYGGGRNDLRDLCQSAATALDTHVLEKRRKAITK